MAIWIFSCGNNDFFLVAENHNEKENTTSEFVITGLPVRDCSDVEKLPIGNKTECQRAASSLGYTFNDAGSWSHNPKGCYLRYGTRVFWNIHKTGSERPDSFAICIPNGKYLLDY